MKANEPPLPGSLRDHVLIVGWPGTGKTLWAREQRLKIPPAEWLRREPDAEYLYRAAGLSEAWHARLQSSPDGTWREAAFRAPHHSISVRGLTGALGAGWRLRPGELLLAHGGVLFLDEANEFSAEARGVVLAAAMEGMTRIDWRGPSLAQNRHENEPHREVSLELPAAFRLIAACNPCPCGWHGHPRQRCECTPKKIERYWQSFETFQRVCRLVLNSEWEPEAKAIRSKGLET